MACTSWKVAFTVHLLIICMLVEHSCCRSICNDGWKPIVDNIYSYPPEPKLCLRESSFPANWTQALYDCRSNGANLLVLDSHLITNIMPSSAVDSVSQQIYDYLNNVPVLFRMWVGVHVDNGKLVWELDVPISVENSSYPGYYWWKNPPNTADGDCGSVTDLLRAETDGYPVELEPCTNELNYACVKSSTVVELQSSQTQCPGEWLGNYDSDKCYWSSNSSTSSFLTAQQKCVDMGGTLAQPTDNFTHSFITSLIGSSSTWIGLYVNQTTVDGSPWTYVYNNATTWNMTDPTKQCISIHNTVVAAYAVAYSNPDITWTSISCDLELQFVCQRPIVVGDVTMTRMPQNDSIPKNFYSDYGLTCEASNYHPAMPVVWVKDGVYINVTRNPPQGFVLNLGRVFTALSLSKVEELQGYYHCEVWGLKSTPQRIRIKSDEALLTFKDVATYYGQLGGVGPLFSADDVTLCNVTICRFQCYQSAVSDLLQQSNSALSLSHAVNSITYNSLRFTVYVQLPDLFQLDPTSWKLILLKNQIYGQLLLLAEGNANGRPLQLTWADACINGMTLGSFGFVAFPLTSRGDTAISFDICVTDGQPVACGFCAGTFTTGAYWQEYIGCGCKSTGNYPSDLASPVSTDLRLLSQREVTFTAVSNITSTLVNLTNNFAILTPDDVTYSSIVLRKIAALSAIQPEIAEDFVTAVNNVASVKTNTLRQAQIQAQSTSRITTSVDAFSDHVVLNDTWPNITQVRENIVFQVFRITHSTEGYGLVVNNATWHTDPTSTDAVVNILNNPSATVSPTMISTTQSAMFFSQEALQRGRQTFDSLYNMPDHSYQVSCVFYSTNSLFGASTTVQMVNSFVISGQINGIPVTNLTEPISIVFQLREEMDISKLLCSYWGFDKLTQQWAWLTEGVWNGSFSDQVNSTLDSTIICYSRHLTNFAVIAGYTGDKDSVIGKVLQYISIIGLSLSIVGLGCVILSVILFRALHKGHSQMVLLQLAIALLAIDILVLTGIDKTDPVAGCKAVAALLLYFLLVAFSWMLVEAVIQYMKFVKVFNTYTSRFMIKTAIPAWIGPGVIVAIVAIVDSYKNNLLRGPVFYCWLAADAFHFAFLLPLGLIMVVNIVMFILVVKGITCDRPKGLQSNQNKGELVKLQVQTAIGCFIVMGLTWLFAFFAIDQAALPFQILFCIFNSLQGFLIFMFLIIRDKSIRDAWKKLICRCCAKQSVDGNTNGRRRKADHDDTQTSERSTSGNSSGNEHTVVVSKFDENNCEKTTDSEENRNRQSNFADGRGRDISVCNDSPGDIYVYRYNSTYKSDSGFD